MQSSIKLCGFKMTLELILHFVHVLIHEVLKCISLMSFEGVTKTQFDAELHGYITDVYIYQVTLASIPT